MKNINWSNFTLFFAVLFLVSISIDDNTQNEQSEIYCEMVLIHNQTGGEFGWPDYKETFDNECQA